MCWLLRGGRTPLRGRKRGADVRFAHEPRKTLHGVSKLALCGGASVTLDPVLTCNRLLRK